MSHAAAAAAEAAYYNSGMGAMQMGHFVRQPVRATPLCLSAPAERPR